ncbi:MAG TPA: heme exporter protein CcmB [Gammaproteobacteria bacterium]|jgi:heme exporter protein B
MSRAGALGACLAVAHRDLLLAVRRRSEIANPLLFTLIIISLFPLAVSPAPETLRLIAPGIVWVVALLAALLTLESLFRADFEDGALEQLLVSPHPLPLLVLAKVSAHWLVTGLPLLLLCPLLGALTHLGAAGIGVLAASLALGTPVLSLVGAIGVALTVGLRRGGALLSLLVLPLYIPVLIFGSNAVSASMDGLPYTGQLLMLGAFLVLSLSLAPLAAAAGLRISMN